jgi:hypothetical protein
MADAVPALETRPCEWCAEAIPAKALKCPKCAKWRKDIDKERVLCWSFSFLAILGFVVFKFGGSDGFRTVGIVLCVISVLLCVAFYAKVSKKIGSWFWA